MTELFFDTYALVAVFVGKPGYQPYAAAPVHTTLLNLFEFYHSLRRLGKSPGEAREVAVDISVVEVTLEDVLQGAEFRFNRNRQLHPRERGISMADAVGYAVARRLGVRFLTGDVKFRGLENVEFVE